VYLDHVLIGVRDLAAAAVRMREQHGLVALDGGLLAGGLRNAIIPLRAGQYLELIAVDGQPSQPPTNAQRWIIEATAAGDRPLWFAVRPDDLTTAARRTGRPIVQNTAAEEGGPMRGSWRSVWPAGGASSGLPFFIDYDTPWREQEAIREADYTRAASPAEPGVIATIEVSGVDEAELAGWLGVAPGTLPVSADRTNDRRGITEVRVSSDREEICIR
jgi:hypothetical protein